MSEVANGADQNASQLKLCPLCRTAQPHSSDNTIFTCSNSDCNHECLSEELFNPPETFETHRILARYAEQANVQFEVAGQPMPASAVFMPELFLPVVVAQAYRIWNRMSVNEDGQTEPDALGAYVFDCADALFGVSAACAPIRAADMTSTLRMLALTKATQEVFLLDSDKPVQLDQFIEQYQQLDWSDGLPALKLNEEILRNNTYLGLPIRIPEDRLESEEPGKAQEPGQGKTMRVTP